MINSLTGLSTACKDNTCLPGYLCIPTSLNTFVCQCLDVSLCVSTTHPQGK